MKTLCVYHSRTGLSKKIAQQLAEEFGAELLCITDGKDRSGFFGYIGAAITGLKKKLPELLPYETKLPVDEYDRLIVTAPVWCEDVSPLMRKFLLENKEKLKGELYLIITHMSNIPYTVKTDKLQDILGKEFKETLSVQTHKHDFTSEVKDFIQSIEKSE